MLLLIIWFHISEFFRQIFMNFLKVLKKLIMEQF